MWEAPASRNERWTRWLDAARGSGRYLRTIDVPGVDTKFVERHRSVLAALLDVRGSASGFVADLGLAAKPDGIRMRFDPGFAGLPSSITEAAFRVDEIADVRLGIAVAVVVENETTFLSLDPPVDGVLFWGQGFDTDRVGRMRWLSDVPVWYWGDLDTHGFAILDRLRAWLPQTKSFLMDRATLLEHRPRWGSEDQPAAARLARLDPAESALYDDLVSDRYGVNVRLEQERLDWRWVLEHLPDSGRRVSCSRFPAGTCSTGITSPRQRWRCLPAFMANWPPGLGPRSRGGVSLPSWLACMDRPLGATVTTRATSTCS